MEDNHDTEFSERIFTHAPEDGGFDDECDSESGDDAETVTTPVKRRRDVSDAAPEERKKRVRRKLFQDDHQDARMKVDDYNDMMEAEMQELKTRPTIDRFVYGNDIIDLRGPLPGYHGSSIILANIYNTFLYIVQYKSTLSALKNRKLAIELRTVEHNMRKLEESNYEGAHVQLPKILESLFTMLEFRHNTTYINQIKPVSCVLNKSYMKEKISYRSMEAKSKNNSNYIEMMFNNPFRFIFVGSAKRGGEHNRNQVNPYPFFGDYIDRVMQDMYDVLYKMVSEEIAKAKRKYCDRDGLDTADEATAAPNNSLKMIEMYSNSRTSKSPDADRLRAFLQRISLPLARRENIDILPTTGNPTNNKSETVKMTYLTVENDKDHGGRGVLKMVETDVTDDAVYVSSYIRCRVQLLEDGQSAFRLQIYTRYAIKLMMLDGEIVKFDQFSTVDNH